MADFKYSAGVDINLNVKGMNNQLKDLQKQLQQISNMKIDIGTGNLTADIEKASEAAMKLSAHLATATNPQTGNLDFTKFYTSIQKSGASLEDYGKALQNMGPAGQKAFVSLADSISKAEIPLKRTSKLVDGMWDNLKKTIGWQMSSSLVHGFIGSMQQAVGYAKDLNKSLTDIRIVTGQSTDQMAQFAKQANQAAKNLSTTTTDYTKASLIYYQQGLSDQEVKARTETTIKMANATGTSAQKVSDQMTAIWNNFDNGTKSLTHYADVMTALGAATASSTDEIAEGLQKFASISDTVGLSYEYAASALATITATSRESADVVGNSLKTLFSRIQGLQLGETLDDGTTLNKYSTALAKVGISIKDSTGELKDMDLILDEMGNKWETLARDEQVALAQTVAGVRQYTQLMTLMENWDKFKQNLNIANTSTGTLDAQAAIYAESWEAASNRVRASWEGLWDTMINSDSMITMLDGLSGIIKAMDTLTTSMGGAGGVLTSFLGIATKLFAPKLSQGLRDTAYNVAMLFGGEKKIKEARNATLDRALKTLDTDGEFGDLYGQNEAEARKAAMKSQIQASLDYAENYNNMTPLQHQIEQQYASATRAQDQRTAEAGGILDSSKNIQFDARMDTYGSYGSGGEYSSLLERTQSVLADQAFNYMYDELGLDFQNPDNQARINAAQQHSQRVQSSDDEIKTKKTGEVLGNFSSALTDFYKATNEAKGPDYLDNLTKAITALETAGYDDETTKNITKRMQEAAAKSVAEGVTANYDGFYKELIQAQGAAAGGTEFGSLLSAWLEKSFNTGVAQFNYDTEKQRGEGLRSGRENNLDGTKNIDWADTLVNAGEGALLALSAGESLLALTESLGDGTADAMSSITSIVSTITQVSMAFASFKTILQAVGMAASKVNIWAAIISTVLTMLPSIFEFLDSKIINEEERMAQAAKTQNELNNAYSQATDRHQNLVKSIQAYGEAQDALTQLTAGTTEWSNSLYEANKIAMDIISSNNLQEGKDYYKDAFGALKIHQNVLNDLTKASEVSLDSVNAANRLKQLDINTQKNIDNENKNLLSESLMSEFLNHPFWNMNERYMDGEELSAEEQQQYNSMRIDGNHFMMSDETYSEDIITAIMQAYAKNTATLDSTDNIRKGLALENYGLVSDLVIDSIYAIRDSIKASMNNTLQTYENEAREFLSDETYRNEDSVMQASGRLLLNEYNKVKENYDNNYKAWAEQYAEATGLNKLKGFTIGKTDAEGNVKYSYMNDSGEPVSDQTMDKGAIQQHQITTSALTNLENSAHQLDEIFTSLNKKSDEADGALESYIAEKGFGKATLQEMQALTGTLDEKKGNKVEAVKTATGLTENELGQIATLEGTTLETWINDLFISLKQATIDAIPYADKVKTNLGAQITQNDDGSIGWDWKGQDNLSDFINNLNVGNLKLLDSTLTNIKATTGQDGLDSYVEGLTALIESADDVDSNALVQMLLALENTGSAAGNLQAIQAIIEGLGGSFEGATSAAQAFAAALAGINSSGLDGILSKLSSIKNALGDVFSLETGGNVGKDVYDNIVKALPQLEGLFTEDILNGGYRYTGSKEGARDIAREAYLSTGDEISNMQDWARTTASNWNNSLGENFSMAEWGDKIASEFMRDNIESTQAGKQNEDIVSDGTALQMFDLLAQGKLGQGALDAVIAQQEGINSEEDITTQLSTYLENMQTMAALMENVTTDNNGDGALDYRDLDASGQEQYLNAQNAANVAQAILSNIWSLIEQLADPEGLQNAAKDFESTKGQTAKDLDQLSEMYNMGEDSDLRAATREESFGKEGSKVMANSADMQNYAENLAFMGSQYEYSAEQAARLSEAIANQDWVTAEALMGQTEMATAIAQTAEVRGLDAEALAAQTSQISEALSEAGLSAQSIAETAADMLIAQEGLDDLTSSAKDFQSIMRKISSGKFVDTKDINDLNKMAQAFDKVAGTADLGVKQTTAWNKAFQKFLKDNPKALQEFTKGQGASIKKFQALQAQMKAQQDTGKDFLTNENDAVDQFGDKMAECSDAIDQMAIGEELGENFAGGAQAAQQLASSMGSAVADIANAGKGIDAATDLMSDATDFELVPVEASSSAEMEANYQDPYLVSMKQLPDGKWEVITAEKDGAKPSMDANGTYKFYKMVKKGGSGGKGGGGGGGGGGGAKEPKKVANKRKSQTVKRYKRNDAKRESASKSKDAAEKQKDYLYGESKIAQMEKINKLAQKEAKITSDRIEESRKYLEEDRSNLIKYMKKYGFEAEFEADGFLANYEEAWTAVYEEIAALYEDNLLTEEEEKIEEDLNVKLEELEGALEDYENSLKELADDIEKWEETLYEMFDNKIEQMEHKVEFKLELDEDSLTYIDFLIENLGDSAVRAIDKIDLIAEKTGYLFNSIQTAYEGVEEIYALSDDPLHLFATGGADIDGLLTESQVEALRGQADSLQDFADQLREIRDTIQEQVAEVFDMWTEKVNHNISALEHYGSVMEYFKNIIDLTGNDIFGLSDEFVRQMESAQIDQSIDQMEANKAYYEELQEMRTNIEAELQKAQASGDAERIAYWEEHLRTVEEEMQTAQDSMLSALESTLSMIADQFTAAMEDAADTFSKSFYASGGLEGLSNDYSLMREQADLMAEDYDKIYNLSKLTRNINKTLDDTNIIAGKQRLNKLLQEVNSLQADNVELSKFDLEYLQAKYELYLAEVELRNAQLNKDTVTLTKDSEGNYSYVYTVNENKVDEAQQKYEDALYEMQNMNHEYIEEMSAGVVETMQTMNDEIASLEISDFANLEEYNARVQEIREKYFAQLKLQESELNKAIGNNQELYETDWKAYSEMTGYKISADKEWINSFRETTLGYLTESKSLFSDFSQTASTYADTLVESLSTAATGYFAQIEEALAAYDTSIANFGSHITGTYKDIQDSSDKTKDKTIEMAKAMKGAFEEVVNTVGNWQDTDGLEITEMLNEIATYLKEIFDAINTSANIKTDSGGSTIGQQEATRLLSSGFEYNGETYSFGSWTFNSRGDLNINDGNGFNKDGSNLVDYHAYLAEQVQDALDAYYSNPDDATLKATAENLIKRYWAYRSIIDRVYDPGEIESNVPKSFDTGGYTGEWGSEGRLAMLHQKEIVLNADDTANFLEALNISRQLIEMIEMNARASSLGLGEMVASTIKDNSQTIEQQVYITAEFPEATNHSEIEEAFDNIINLASQYAFRRD